LFEANPFGDKPELLGEKRRIYEKEISRSLGGEDGFNQ